MRIINDWVSLLILLLSIAATFYTANYIYKRELVSSLTQLEIDVEKYAAYINSETERSLTLLATLKSFLSVSSVRRDVFHSVADDALGRYQQLQGIVWVPLVDHEDRAFYEKFQQKFIPDFEFKHYDGNALVRAPDNKVYLPVYYQRSKGNDHLGVGLDLSSTTIGSALVDLEGDTTDRLLVDMLPAYGDRLKNAGEVEHYLTVVLPVYIKNEVSVESFKGFLIGAIRVESLLQYFLEDPQHQFIDITIADVTNPDNTILINVREDTPGGEILDDYEYRTELVTAAGRRWMVEASPTERYMELVSPHQWIYAIVIGLIINFLLALYIYSLRSRNIVVHQLVKEKTRQLETANYKLEKLSITDSLTRVANRRRFDEYLEAEWLRARREKRSLSLLLIDIDFFKQYNDSYGHTKGDSCLQEVALSLRSCFTRSTDLFARYGGEEFAAILPSTNLDTRMLVDKCCRVIEEQKILHQSSSVSDYVTISLGACTVVPSDTLQVVDLIKAADKALYRAKNEGRNRGVIFDFQQGKVSQGITDSR